MVLGINCCAAVDVPARLDRVPQTRAPTFTCRETDTLGLAIGRLAATHAHRIFVVDADHHPLRVISVTDVLRTALA